jgi:uncharacterized SAM-binding protein YcdF (DUF218 family)
MFDQECAITLWNYHHLNQEIKKSDGIIAFGSHDLHVAERAAELYLSGLGKYIIFTGGLGRITQNIWKKPEADKFAEIAIAAGVPKDVIYIENESTNTGENIQFTKKLISNTGISIENVIVVDKPFKERRLYATLRKQWPELIFTVTSPQNTFEEYLSYYQNSKELSVDDFINIMVGDLQRIDVYGCNGFQIKQEIPLTVWNAYNQLVRNGYNEQLIKVT